MANVKVLKEMLEGRDENLHVVMQDGNNYDRYLHFNGVHQEKLELEDGTVVEALVLRPYVPVRPRIRRTW